MPLRPLFCWLSIILISSSLPLSGQQKVWRHYSLSNGLLSNEVFETMQDNAGFLWFTTARGICRFNGYDFIQPVDNSSYAGAEAFFPTEDTKGKIWFARLDATLWYIENDTIKEWPFNHVTMPYRNKAIVENLGIETDGTKWIGIKSGGFLVVDTTGKIHTERVSKKDNILFGEFGKRLAYASIQLNRNLIDHNKDFDDDLELYVKKGDTSIFITEFSILKQEQKYESRVYRIGLDSFIVDKKFEIIFISGKNIQWRKPTEIISQKIVNVPGGKLLLATNNAAAPGLYYFQSLNDFKNNFGINLMPGKFISDIFCDKHGGWWTCTINDGIYYCKNPNIDVYNIGSGLPSDDVVQLTTDGESKLFLGFRPASIYSINTKNNRLKKEGEPLMVSREIWGLEFDPASGWLWSSEPLQYLVPGGQWQLANWNTNESSSKVLSAKKIHIFPAEKYVYISSYSGWNVIDATAKKIVLSSARTPDIEGRTHDIALDNSGRTWITTHRGTHFFNKDAKNWTRIEYPELKHQPRDLTPLPSGGMVIGSRGAGIIITEPGDFFYHFAKKDGLASDNVSKIRVTGTENIYVCSDSGLSLLEKNDTGWNIKTLSTKDGLPSNQINDVIELNGNLWVATDKGLAHVSHWPVVSLVPEPSIDQVQINNKRLIDFLNPTLAYKQNNISISYSSIHFPSEGNIAYRYRLIGADTNYHFTANRTVNFPNLASGQYRFEVQAHSGSNAWTKPCILSFIIKPPWWRTGWFIILTVLAFGFITAWIVRNRLNDDRKKAKAELRMKELELSALRAQINPHFIFNCLGSIQQFIATNNADAATRYLARFAKLVRTALHSSVDGQHSLEDEMDMLDNYLALEQMRFKNKFTYSIKADDELAREEVFLPAMLLQPFVENAVLHGVRHSSGNGRIEIQFSKIDGKLQATITDNGPGLSAENQSNSHEHKSVGMTLTGKRLALIKGLKSGHSYSHENLVNELNQVVGSRVNIDIPVS